MPTIGKTTPEERWLRQRPETLNIPVPEGKLPFIICAFRQTPLTPQEWGQAAQYLYSAFGIELYNDDLFDTADVVPDGFSVGHHPAIEVKATPIVVKKSFEPAP